MTMTSTNEWLGYPPDMPDDMDMWLVGFSTTGVGMWTAEYEPGITDYVFHGARHEDGWITEVCLCQWVDEDWEEIAKLHLHKPIKNHDQIVTWPGLGELVDRYLLGELT